uniref:DUF4136 domain-containing protein n=1 Tax=Gelidibacter sp. TaxID=2018083 RepID=UPI00404A4C10
MKNFLILFIVLIITSCAPIRVNYDYDKSTDFNNYKTYNYYKELTTGLSELDTKRLVEAINSEMQTKGFLISEDPDFLINIQSSEFQEAQRSSVGVGLGGGGRNVGGGVSIGIPMGQNQMNRQIVIEFVDENKTGLFWEAVSESSFNPNASPEKREVQFQTIVAKIFAQYPPIKK